MRGSIKQMTLNTPPGKETAPEHNDVLAAVERHFDRAILALDILVASLETGEGQDVTDIKKRTGEARAAMQSVIDERKRVDQARNKAPGFEAGGELDLDAARDEIGRRMVVLRRAGGSGSIPDQPE